MHSIRMFCTNYVGNVYVGGYDGLDESGLFRELCRLFCSWSRSVGFVVVMSYTDCGDDSAC